MPPTEMIVTIFLSIMASSGFWAFVQFIQTRKSATTQLLLGLAHDRIIFLGMSYIERGWLTKDEYEDFMKYLCAPYSKFGGNGLAEKVQEDVSKLPIYNYPRDSQHRSTNLKVVQNEDQ